MCEERTGKNAKRKSVFRWDRGLEGGAGASETGGEAAVGEKGEREGETGWSLGLGWKMRRETFLA